MRLSSLLMQPHDYILQPTSRLETPWQILFWKNRERKGCSKISRIPKYHFQICPFPWTFQSRISESTKTDPKKNVSCECTNMAGEIYQEKVLEVLWSHFIKVTELQSKIYTLMKKSHQWMFGKHCCFESSRKFTEKRRLWSSFKTTWAVKSTTYSYTGNWLRSKYFLEVYKTPRKACKCT